MQALVERCGCVVLAAVLAGCASQWKIQGGPRECAQMCQSWDMELTGMVGVGSQDPTGPGATACVCELRKSPAAASKSPVAEAGTTAGTAAAIVAIQEAEQQQHQNYYQHSSR